MKLRSLKRNFIWKVASLCAAIVAWIVVNGPGELSTSISVPVQYRNLPRDLDVSSEMVEQVHLNLRGATTRLARVAPSSLPIVIDLKNVTSPGERTFTVNESNLQLPNGVTVERIIPSQIRLRLEVRQRRQVPVLVRYTGQNAAPVEYTPTTLEIVGPESHVARIHQVETDPVDVELLTLRGEARAEAFSGDPQVRFTVPAVIRVKLSEKRPQNN